MKNEVISVTIDVEKIEEYVCEVLAMLETKHGLDAKESAFASVYSAIVALSVAHPDFESLPKDVAVRYLRVNIGNILDALLKK